MNSQIEILKNKVEIYEKLLHQIQMQAEVTCDLAKVSQLIRNICNWSYAHRCGNGALTEEEQEERIQRAFQNLLDVK